MGQKTFLPVSEQALLEAKCSNNRGSQEVKGKVRSCEEELSLHELDGKSETWAAKTLV